MQADEQELRQRCERLATELIERYAKAECRLGVAESCTGGLLGAIITSISGASCVFEGSLVTYSNAAKTTILGVPADLLAAHGAVSEQVAIAMAEGVLGILPACRIAASITGVAGPESSENKPVGLVYTAIAVRSPARTETKATAHRFSGTRTLIRLHTAEKILRRLNLTLKNT